MGLKYGWVSARTDTIYGWAKGKTIQDVNVKDKIKMDYAWGLIQGPSFALYEHRRQLSGGGGANLLTNKGVPKGMPDSSRYCLSLEWLYTNTKEMVTTWMVELRFKARNTRTLHLVTDTRWKVAWRLSGDTGTKLKHRGPAHQKGVICFGCNFASVECLFTTSALRLILWSSVIDGREFRCEGLKGMK